MSSHVPDESPTSNDSPTAPPERFPGQGSLGSFLLLLGSGIAVLAFIDRIAGLPFEMPRSWYSTPAFLWYFFAFGIFLAGMKLLKSPPVEDHRNWRPDPPGQRFERIVIYSREGCHLCDQAKDVLLAYRKWLPDVEMVDITSDPDLLAKFSDQIPVVEIDGQIRFRGQVNEILLRRLINATAPKRNRHAAD